MPARLRALTPAVALLAWSALAVVVQRWASIEDGIADGYAVDARSYLEIAEAAPGLPDDGIVVRPFAERFPVHWLIGALSDLSGLSLESLYRLASVLCVAGIVAVAHMTLRGLGLEARAHLLALGAVAASAYPLHYLLAAPAMVSDGVFVLGLTVTLLAFVRRSFPLVLIGLVVAVLGRQTAVPVVIVAAAWIAASPTWRTVRWRRAAAALVVPLVAYLVARTVADGFAVPRATELDESTVVGYFDGVGELADHLGRIALGIGLPAALVLGAWLRVRGPLPRGALLLAAAVVAQPLLLGPATNGNNEPRLAGLALPALALAAGALLARARLSGGEAAVIAAAIAIAGLHPRYTWPLPGGNVTWAVVELTAAALVVAVLSWPAVGRHAIGESRARSFGR